jgi:hypothetical protein
MAPVLKGKSIGLDQKIVLKRELLNLREPRIRLGTKVHSKSRIQFASNQSKLVPRKLEPGPSSKLGIMVRQPNWRLGVQIPTGPSMRTVIYPGG